MAKAQLTTPQGIKVNIEGTPEEITALLRQLEAKNNGRAPEQVGPTKIKRGKTQLVDLIASLVDGGFFKSKRNLGDVKNALAELGHHYPLTTLSGVMLRQVRKRNIRRIREDKRWVYVQ